MALTPGTKIGPYEITAPLGAGGMGEVYRARDTRLGRDVALKVLPEAVARNEDRLARFEREAQVLASLNHPNIAAIYGVEDSTGGRALVMELVPGPTLAERVAQGPVALDEALSIARQIAAALEYAHEHGIIHRDLKPANVKLTPEGEVKLLDFGLAKALDDSPAASGIENSPTISAVATRAGVILGTAAYMSPEQARGRAADRRADIWAFGCVLYELLTGKRPFAGESVSDVLAAVIMKEPDWTAVPQSSPAAVRKLLRRCLDKDPKRRLQAIGEARILFEKPDADSTPEELAAALATPRAARPRALQWGIAGILLGALFTGILFSITSPRPADRPVQRLSIALPAGVSLSDPTYSELALSPDGNDLIFSARQGDKTQLYRRRMAELDAKPIDGTAGGVAPFFSPDGASVAFVTGTNSGLRRVPLAGGPAQSLCVASSAHPGITGLELSRGSSWAPDGTIFFASAQFGGLLRVPSAGGDCRDLTRPDSSRGEVAHAMPQVLPGGESLLFDIFFQLYNPAQANIAALSLKTGKWQTLIRQGTDPHYVSGGFLVYARDRTLMAVPFDPSSLRMSGSPVPVVENVMTSSEFGASQFTVALNGTLAYIVGNAAEANRKLMLVDRSGKSLALPASEGAYEDLALSPDGRRIALTIEGAAWQIGIYDMQREILARFTLENDNRDPIWTKDGKRLAYSSFRDRKYGIYWKLADGNGPEEQLVSSADWVYPNSFSPDGKALAYGVQTRETGFDLWIVPLEGDRKPRPFANTRFNEFRAGFSPDGRWLAYESDESGRAEIYVQEFPGPGRKLQISNQGGQMPIWSHDGRELFYRMGSKLMAVPIETKTSFVPGLPHQLSEGNYLVSGHSYDVIPGSNQFVFIQESDQPQTATHINVVLNWFDELKRLMAAQKQ